MKNWSGKKLLSLGYKGSKHFSNTIAHLNAIDATEAQAMAYIDALLSAMPVEILPYKEAKGYFVNLDANDDDAEAAFIAENYEKVKQTMDEVMKTPTVLAGAVMPDACPAGGVGNIPVGGVVVTDNAIHPSMHSADICCSVYNTTFPKGILCKDVLNAAHTVTHFGKGWRSDNIFEIVPELQKELDVIIEKMKANVWLNDPKSIDFARKYLGTQGDGNHFLFVGTSENDGTVRMVTHHGSRGLGARLYSKGKDYAKKYTAKVSPKTNPINAWIPLDSIEGETYWDALQIVRAWTKLNHKVIHNMTSRLLGLDASETENFWNEHNFVFKDDAGKVYHAKGATPLDDKFVPDSKEGLRLIPLNMAQPVLVVKGKTTETNLGFAPHGAGRNMSRTAHAATKGNKSGYEIYAEETQGIDARFYSGKMDLSELPSAYKNADKVVAQIEKYGLGTVVDKIHPYGCIMAGHQDAPRYKRK